MQGLRVPSSEQVGQGEDLEFALKGGYRAVVCSRQFAKRNPSEDALVGQSRQPFVGTTSQGLEPGQEG